MPWQYQRAEARIRDLIAKAPKAGFTIENYTDSFKTLRKSQYLAEKGHTLKGALVDLPHHEAVLVDGVHVYASLVNFNDLLIDDGAETEASHERAMQFLHTYYSAFDRLIDQHGAIRVDFHGPRLHAVIAEPFDDERVRIEGAVALAHDFKLLADQVNDEFFEGNCPAILCVGIDSGKCLAIDDGSAKEAEPLFLGSPANRAAKLAEMGVEGLFLSPHVEEILKIGFANPDFLPPMSGRPILEGFAAIRGQSGITASTDPIYQKSEQRVDQILKDWRTDFATGVTSKGLPNFTFYKHDLPLKTIDFSELMPSNSVRMMMSAFFADVDGYSKFVDEAILSGNAQDALQVIHVIRGELKNVVTDDFGGRKVRFIGDCIHGVIADGGENQPDAKKSVGIAVECAAAMRSSFDLAQELLGQSNHLGLAVGIELGETPVSRFGIRGDRSIRCCTGLASKEAEVVQRDLEGTQTGLGINAFRHAPNDIREYFGDNGVIDNLSYDVYEEAFKDSALAAPAIISSTSHSHTTEPFRAHATESWLIIDN